ncbi:protein LSM14 homolog B-like isoform X2 [Nerophis lumbriciformis]|uniref:protein LSM14 homolog B-like isoform X2 n=1 Tax=Nerophis lumbriciformis TaxID=546530 RepID=UPI002ADF372B|nr:protein LSM14 homolog B-like isoform X2 [Nerophis lumbriciformis]
MSFTKPYIGCKIGLLSKAQNRYEGILYTIDKVNSTVVLAKVKCFGTEGRPTERPTPPKDDIYEYITFRGSDIKDITLCEAPRHHGLPPDPAIVQSQSSSAGTSSIYPPLGPFSPMQMPAYNQLAAASLLNQQYAAALGLGPMLPGLHVRRGPMVEKAVQTLWVEDTRQRRGLTIPQEQEQRWERRRPFRTREETTTAPRRGIVSSVRSGLVVPDARQSSQQQNDENRPPTRRQGPRRRSNRSRGSLIVAKIPSATLKFDTDFDFDSSNAQFNKEELEREVQARMKIKDGNPDTGEKQGDGAHPNTYDHFGPKCYYDKAKSFFDNISSDNKLWLTWAEERKRNMETFGLPGRFRRGQGFRGGYIGQRGRDAAQTGIPYRSGNGQL